jgi:hypothetical protein
MLPLLKAATGVAALQTAPASTAAASAFRVALQFLVVILSVSEGSQPRRPSH